MKTQFASSAAAVAVLASAVSAQGQGHPGGNGWNGAPSGAPSGAPWAGAGGGPSCLSNCWSDLSGVNWSNGMSSLCSNTTAIDSLNSCISSSSCNETDKSSTYQVLAQICANAGHAISASPEASFSATSGGSAYPTTNTAWSSYASYWSTVTGAPTAAPFNASGAPGWRPGGGYGPFGQGGPGNGYGSWGSSGSWTNGPWTSWWGSSACPPSTWSGWTSGPWGTNPPWTSWSGCTASTTASSVVTSTVTTGGSSSVVTTTAFGVQVAAATTGGTATGSAAKATSSGSSGERRAVASAGVGLGAVLAAMLML